MQQTNTSAGHLERGMGLWGAIAANVLNMVGVGPFLTIPLALAAMGGPQAMLGWVLGAVLSLCDGMVWAELGSRFPDSGGPYYFLLYGFGEHGLGRLLAFLFLWQSLLTGPISIASGAVGFADYASVFHALTHTQRGFIAMGVCLLNVALLYRSIRSIATISVLVTTVVLATCLWIFIAGATHFHASLAFDFPSGAFHLSRGFWMGLGSSTLIATYDYGGYGNVCLLGGEIRHPRRTIPRALIASILLVAVMYLAMNLAIIGVLPWSSELHSTAIVADLMAAVYGPWAPQAASLLILIASWGSAFAILLGYSRIPYAAAVDGAFPAAFARLSRKHGTVPVTSLLFMGLLSAVLCFFTLETLIAALIIVQTLLQFIAQCVAVIRLRVLHPQAEIYRMPLFPLPALLAIAGWLYILGTSNLRFLATAVLLAVVGVAYYLVQAHRKQEWPFRHA
ncbi:amino acid/polyamine/organocation transporter, APC superfamily [Bryocella elongata]|uniref:Amino acid/polyamine/organocation transporter, APC superfamily n=1 Tax=Bryocella elongata TaxID=863522 RepID=A0A1H5UUR5_9BACT|nr:APC family permease [Bryocella elongata]SEF78221.1 amino acid/polyamine/organocation transporter, APC superfamily [Bryocella elongata]